MTTDLTAVWSV